MKVIFFISRRTPRARVQRKTQTTTRLEIHPGLLELAVWQQFQCFGPYLSRVWISTVLKNKHSWANMKLFVVQEKSDFITARLCKSLNSAIVFWVRKEVASHCRSPSVLWVPPPRSMPWLTQQYLSHFLQFNVFQEEGRMCLIIIKFFCEIKNASDFVWP